MKKKSKKYLLMEEEQPVSDKNRSDLPQQKYAVGYIRVSTKQQAGDDRMGRDAQKAAITKYANENNYEIIRWYTDEVSGVKEHREALDEILFTDKLDEAGVNAVIAYKSDRFARDIKLYFYYLFTLEKRHIRLLSVNENFDDDEYGLSSVYRSLMLFVAEQERKNIRMRTMAGRKVKAQNGGYSGGRVPYGYSVYGKQLIINEKEAEIVRLVFLLREQKCTFQEISDILNDRGYKTRRGRYFGTSQVASILNNEKFYQGYYKYGDMEKYVKGQHEPIIARRIMAISDIDFAAAKIEKEEHDAEQSDREYPMIETREASEDIKVVPDYMKKRETPQSEPYRPVADDTVYDTVYDTTSDTNDDIEPENDDIEIGADISFDETDTDEMQENLQDEPSQPEAVNPAPFVGGVFRG